MNNTDLIEQLFSTVMQLRKLISQRTYKSHEEKVATMLQFSALHFLKDRLEISVGDLAQYLQLSKSSATQLIERLARMKLVKRVADKQDRRVIHLVITTKGKDEFLILKKKTMKKMNRILTKIPKKDVKDLIRIHTNLIEALKKENS